MTLTDILIPEAVLAAQEGLLGPELPDQPAVDADHPAYGAAYRHYRLLTSLPAQIAAELSITDEVVFYNRYFWLARVTQLQLLAHGPDAGQEQMLFKLLEHPPDELDWALLEQIDHLARAGPLPPTQATSQ